VQCKVCGNEMFAERIFGEGGELIDICHTCVNKNCSEYLKPDKALDTKFKVSNHEK